ncbi:hypothetical protein FVQ98_01670 [Ottowia sp. GY511]|uniref:Tripartite tricarboxylate transporter TctB family protein n=1 Tax=Ottowia flava TaxID=2675430 RepID=A0ABW4KWX5_9BURK|nr:hypothetical protein [Ottowia sp. GY511]TXK33607.1 hypothetical protein FVQ98_01670 [Ottowia sp. GY511]
MSAPDASEADESGYLLSAVLIGVLAALLWAVLAAEQRTGYLDQGDAAVWPGAYVMAWGAMFGLSYWWFFLRGLMWLCEHGSRPSGRKMAWFYAALGGFLGLMGAFKGLGWLG